MCTGKSGSREASCQKGREKKAKNFITRGIKQRIKIFPDLGKISWPCQNTWKTFPLSHPCAKKHSLALYHSHARDHTLANTHTHTHVFSSSVGRKNDPLKRKYFFLSLFSSNLIRSLRLKIYSEFDVGRLRRPTKGANLAVICRKKYFYKLFSSNVNFEVHYILPSWDMSNRSTHISSPFFTQPNFKVILRGFQPIYPIKTK